MKKDAVMIVAEPESAYPHFAMPVGYREPEGTKEGDTFEAVGTFRLKPDGQLCLVEIDGVELEDAPEEEMVEPMQEDEEMMDETTSVGQNFTKFRDDKMKQMM